MTWGSEARASEVVSALEAVLAGRPLEPSVEQALVAEGWAVAFTVSTSGAPEARAELGRVAERRRQLLGATDLGRDPSLQAELGALDERERQIRKTLLEASVAAAAVEGGAKPGASALRLTARGRELHDELHNRRERLGEASLTDFQAARAELRDRLARRVARARELLQTLGPTLHDEPSGAYARAAAFALVDSPLADPVGTFRAALALADTIPQELRPAAAEAVTLHSSGQAELPAVWKTWTELVDALAKPPTEDAVDAVTLVLGLPEAERRAALARADQWRRRLGGGRVAPLVLLALAGTDERSVLEELPRWEQRPELQQLHDPLQARFVAALLLSSAGSIERFQALRAWLEGFGGSRLGAVAALLGFIDAPAAHVLDDLRMAAAEVERALPTFDAAENLSLAAGVLLAEHPLARARPEGVQVALPTVPLRRPLALVAAAYSAGPSARQTSRSWDQDSVWSSHRVHRGGTFG